MLKIRALNRESSSDEEVPVIRREAQEEIALELYNKALRLQSADKLAEADEILLNLINENIPQLENHGGLPSSMSTLKYSCYFNLGNIYIKKGDLDNALDYYLNASELDSTDVTLWYKIGKLAIKQNRFRQAAYALSKGLECSESHWPCLDQLISLLYAMKDTVSCLLYIGKALLLDPDYTKGLVLRRQIYRDNPATIHIWEPPLDVSIDEEDEKMLLKKEQILCDKITEVEKSLGPKPLQTIPLPKALKDYTWVSLGKVVIDLHQYITNNNMSHFTMVDINKCMSQTDVVMEELVKFDVPEKVVEEVIPEKTIEAEMEEEKEKMEVEAVIERRQSQNSETNNEGQENTPIQTDNDEEQPMEQDGEDQEDNADNKTDKNRTLNKSNKRKRDLLSDLQIWGWHSKRKSAKKGKPDKDFSVEDALNRIIPNNLLKNKVGEEKYNQFEDSMNTIDIYNMYVEDQHVNILSPIHSPKSINFEEYFDTDREREDVLNLWSKEREYCDAIVLIRDFVISLSKLWHVKWPKELVQMFIEAYSMYKEHYDHPQVFSGESPFQEMRDDALATLLYGELLNFSSPKSETRVIHVTSLAFLQVISGWQEDWQQEFVSVFIRVYWLRTHIFRKEGNNDLAIRALELIQEVILEEEKRSDEKYFLSLPNCFKCGLVTNEIASKILKHLDMITSLNCIEELYNAEKYREVAEILKLTFNSSGNHPTCGKMGRPAQLAMLLHSLWYTDLTECFVWTEECLYEALAHFLKPVRDCDKWEKIVEKCLAFFQEIIKMETVGVVDTLNEDKRARLVETLAKIVCKQLNADNTSKIPLGCITPWILLHYILVREEHRQQASKRVGHIKTDKNYNDMSDFQNEDVLPPSIAILFSAHEFLGPKGWCLTGNGELLHFILDTVLDRLDTPIFEPLREKIDIHIEQALFCLYQHPSKKNKISRHLADHNVDPLPLTWERAFQLYDFYGPDCLPEFNSYKNASISSDLEQLLQRIIALVPSTMDPQPHMPKLSEFIHGKATELPEPINFSIKVRAIYYLIGDYYFKQREFNRCIKYFMMDLCINPMRVDSWACIGLSYLSQLENKLNYCKKLKSEMEFLDKAKCAQVSFKKALELEKDHIMLWIEFGSFEYMVHSFCSRVMKSESDTLSMEKFEYLENQKNSYLESSGRSFEKAIQLYQPDEAEADERWLQYYILGKVAEKKQEEPNEYLQYYVTAGKLLHENNAMYPEKINYHNPQHLSVEALELHYRIHASILKYLELHEGKEIPNSIGNMFKEYLDKSYFPRKALIKQFLPNQPPLTDSVKEAANKTVTEASEKIKNEEIQKDVKNCLEDVLEKVDNMIKEQAERDINMNKKAENDKEESDGLSDVIMISDSEDEQPKRQTIEESRESHPKSQSIGKDVQDLLDKMMEETMKKTEEQELDSDTSITSKNVVEVKTEESKIDINKNIRESKMKSGSETETDRRTSVDDSSSSPSSSSSSSSSSDSDSDDDSSSSSSSSSSETTNGNMSNGEILALVDKCIVGLEQCVIRLPQNYKALYRLAHLYFNYKAKKDLNKCKQLLLSEYTCKGGVVITGLFSDRKNHNFFNGIWRIPSSEIDRPGSLSAHMSRCITLLLQILRATNDNKLLLDLSMLFRKTPDPDKIYVKDSERLQFADQAMAMCVQSLRSQIQNVPNMNETAVQRLLQEVFRSYQRVQKHETNKEATFASMLTEVYRKLKKDKLPENVNVLDLATKFCQQNRLAEKQKRQMQSQTALLRGPGITNPPVLPAPSTVGPSNQPLLKRPGVGRPRGRPPLPKIPGQARVSRGRSPNITTNPYSWQKTMLEQNATYNYLKHYQEELIKQYSQSLNLTQLTQLSQYFTQNQFANALAQSQFGNQFLGGQNPLLNSPSLLKQMSSSQFMSPQLGDAGKSAGYKKKSDKLSITPGGLTMDSLKSYGALAQPMSTKSSNYNKKNLPQTITSASQAATISKVKTTGPSSIYNVNLPHSITNLSQSSVNKAKAFPSKVESSVTHTVTAMTQVPVTCKTKSAFTPSAFKSTYTGAVNYPSADIAKISKTGAATKTTPSSQVFKEPTVTKAHPTVHHKAMDKAANILMKERPNISITPVLQSTIPLITTSSFMAPSQTSTGKTLQEKLADKQKQLSTKQLGRHIEAEIISTPVGSTVKKNLNIPSIPSSLTVSKASSYKFPLESGISISQIPVTQPYKSMEAINLQHRKEPPHKFQKSISEVNLPPNLPISLSVMKKPERKPSSDDDVILIDFKQKIELEGFTLLLPTVSVGNVPQLAIDLLITSLDFKKVATIWHPAVVSSVGADPYEVDGPDICTACELYVKENLKLALIQLRSTINRRLATRFFADLKTSLLQYRFKNVIILTSSFDYEMHVISSNKFYYISNREIGEVMKGIDVKPKEAEFNGKYLVHGSGFAVKMYESLEESLECVMLIKYVSEGDNRPDAITTLETL
ncbi:calcineurin-binding protein cabin-1, partial [Asbolus verrucosus]